MNTPTVAVLGAGIMGSCIALLLARKNIGVKLIDACDKPFSGASRWNEGKIHLGYLYGADPSLRTAKKLIPGGLSFPRLVKELIGREIPAGCVTASDDHYLIHRDSIVDPSQFSNFTKAVSLLAQDHPDARDYFVPLDVHIPRVLDQSELSRAYDTRVIKAAFKVPERSVETNAVADYFVGALENSERIELIMSHRVLSVKNLAKNKGWSVVAADPSGKEVVLDNFKVVINALWEGRRVIDQIVGLPGPKSWTHRYRASLFAKTKHPVNLSSAVIAVGPFGDVKNYNGRHLYMSWYHTGLLAQGHELAPPHVVLPGQDREKSIAMEMMTQLGNVIPEINNLPDKLDTCMLRGGWVYAAGRGALDDASSDLHRRDRIGTFSRKGYFSIDTGKYSMAPWLAAQLAKDIR